MGREKKHLSAEELRRYLEENTGYLKWGVGKIKNMFASENVDETQVQEIRSKVRDKVRDEESPETTYEGEVKPTPPSSTGDSAKENSNLTPLQRFLNQHGLDEEEVSKYTIWEGADGSTKFSVKVRSDYRSDFEHITKYFSDRLEDISTPKIDKPTPSNPRDFCGVIGLHDAHIDKVVLASETGYDTDDTIEDNVQTFKQKSIRLIDEAKEKGVKRLFFPVGSDFWTVNDDRNTTKRGTPQRVIVPFQESFETGSEMLIEVLRYAAEQFPVVTVPVIYGNHDEDLDFFLGMLLKHAFSSTSHVNIDYSRKERKYYRFGKCGFLMAHGYHCKTRSKMQRLPSNFAEEATDIWANTKGGIRKAFLGDIHNEEQYQFLRSKDSVGLNVQFMRSVTNSGKYEWQNGWTGVPKTAYLWTYDRKGSVENVNKKVWW
jgi:hypothetical protein